jgi:hypothetical protein
MNAAVRGEPSHSPGDEGLFTLNAPEHAEMQANPAMNSVFY